MMVEVNGRLIRVDSNSTSKAVKSQQSVQARDQLVEISGGKLRKVGQNEKLKANAKYRSIPPIEQGGGHDVK